MNVLGLYFGHNSTVCLLQDGVMTACVSEERFSGIKNDSGFPHRALQWILDTTGLSCSDIDIVVFPSAAGPILRVEEKAAGGFKGKLHVAWDWLYDNIGRLIISVPGGNQSYRILYDHVYWPIKKHSHRPYVDAFQQHGGVPKQWRAIDHHAAHAYSALWGVAPRGEDNRPLDTLVLTCDGEGDLLSATVGTWQNGKYSKIADTSNHDSLGLFYSAVTSYLGMKPLEHEYKVMGLAPYVDEEWVQRGLKAFSGIIEVDGLKFRSSVPSRAYLPLLDKKLRRVRFDAIAGGLQRLTENLLTEWVANACKNTGLSRVTAGGGVMMNVKANGAISRLPEVDYFSACPSAADESTAIGCAYYGHCLLQKDTPPQPLTDVYLGVDCGKKEADTILRTQTNQSFTVRDIGDNEAEEVAALLADGKIVARCVGRCEFGARALGNRSIIARPDRPDLIRTLNGQIKHRDFWMPFAGTILESAANTYLVGSKKSYGAHMMIAYPTRPDVRSQVAAATHPYDYTMRPQILAPEKNRGYAAIIEAFQQRTGIPAVLNTSLNIHGDPMVGGADLGMKTFLESGLQYMVLGPYLLTKNG